MIKKRQYHIWQYTLEDLYEKDGKLMVNFSTDDAVTTSETLMYYILNEKIRNKEYKEIGEQEIDDKDAEGKNDTNGNKKVNKLPIITIETGRSRDKKQTTKLQKLLKEGFYIKTEPLEHFVFLDNVLSGSQNKECRQIFVYEDQYEKLKEYVSLGIEPSKCTISKNLTRNALTTTDVYLVPVDMKELGICIIPDCEVPVHEDVRMVKPYTRTSEEEKQYEELMAWIAAKKQYSKKVKIGSELVNAGSCSIKNWIREIVRN